MVRLIRPMAAARWDGAPAFRQANNAVAENNMAAKGRRKHKNDASDLVSNFCCSEFPFATSARFCG